MEKPIAKLAALAFGFSADDAGRNGCIREHDDRHLVALFRIAQLVRIGGSFGADADSGGRRRRGYRRGVWRAVERPAHGSSGRLPKRRYLDKVIKRVDDVAQGKVGRKEKAGVVDELDGKVLPRFGKVAQAKHVNL